MRTHMIQRAKGSLAGFALCAPVMLLGSVAIASAVGHAASPEVIFADGFESGDVSSWSVAFPPDPSEPAQGLFFVPTVLELTGLGESGEVALTLRDFPRSLWGVQLHLSFDPGVVQVTSIESGQCPPPELVVARGIDNSTGTVTYAAVPLELGPCAVTSGDLTILHVRVQRVGEGVALIVIEPGDSRLSDGDIAVDVPMRDGWIIP